MSYGNDPHDGQPVELFIDVGLMLDDTMANNVGSTDNEPM